MFARFLILASIVFLTACRANEVEIELKEADLRQAALGQTAIVPFEAVFENLGDLDQEQRDQIDQIRAILAQYMTVAAFDIETTGNGYEITIEGEIRVSQEKELQDPWYLHVTPSSTVPGFDRVQVVTGHSFESLQNRMQDVSFLLAPDAFHPTQFRLRSDSLEVIAPAVQKDGQFHLFWRSVISGRTNFNFSDGAFDGVGAGFLFR